ncbi:serine protease inhibitor 42Dd-like [Diabrotica undecimpunctata]|uniref:serine protease inhibitor 42Dd-like n=1 Tax=Diabrotica undecimpunctata TaxID=50387 RepID=UPI003B64215C
MFRALIPCFLCALAFGYEEDDIALLATVNQDLATDIYTELTTDEERDNFIFSPLSAQLVLSLISAGAAGSTRAELEAYLPPSTTVFGSYLSRLHNIENKTVYNSANRIFTRRDIRLNRDFAKIAREVYRTTVQKVNFLEPRQAANSINEWVNWQLLSQKKDSVRPAVIADYMNPHTNLMFLSVIYLNVTWEKSFHSRTDKFYNEGSKVAKMIPFLARTGIYKYYDDKEIKAKFVEIPFTDIHFSTERVSRYLSLVLVVPYKKDGLKQLSINSQKVFQPKPYTNETMRLRFPKFSVGSIVDIGEIFKSLGIKKMFSRKDADFTNLAYNRYRRYYFTKVLQESYIDINERGVELVGGDQSETPTRSFQPSLSVDHPFIYYIQREGVIIFAGRVTNLPN